MQNLKICGSSPREEIRFFLCFTFLAKRITAFFQLKFSTEVVDEVLKNKRKLQESIIKSLSSLENFKAVRSDRQCFALSDICEYKNDRGGLHPRII